MDPSLRGATRRRNPEHTFAEGTPCKSIPLGMDIAAKSTRSQHLSYNEALTCLKKY